MFTLHEKYRKRSAEPKGFSIDQAKNSSDYQLRLLKY